MHFLDLRTDFAFKKVFGSEESKGRLISFLNSVIYSGCKQQIEDLTIVDPYNIPMLKGMKDTFVDVKAVLNDQTRVIIEMQVLPHEGFEKRILYNAAKNYSVQLVSGEQYHLLNPVIALSIVDFTMFRDSEKLITRFKMLEKEEFIQYGDDLELIFVELPKFTKTLEELENIQDEWLWFIKNSGTLEYSPKTISRDIQGAFDVANEGTLSPEELELQHKKQEYIAIHKGSIALAKRQGVAQGIEQVAISLLDLLEDVVIAEKTGLTVDQIQKLRVRSSQ